MAITRPMYGRILPALTSSQQRGVHLAPDRRRERVEPKRRISTGMSLYPIITPMTVMLPIDTLRSGRPVSPDSGSSLKPTGT